MAKNSTKWTLPAQEEIKVYLNDGGGVTIEQTDPTNTENPTIFVSAESLPKLIRFLQEANRLVRYHREEDRRAGEQEEEQEH